LEYELVQRFDLTDGIHKILTLPPQGELVRVGRAIGISFGNE
jgi:hypothetical protein